MRTRLDSHSSRVRLAALGALLALLSVTTWATSLGPDAGGYKATDVTAFSFIDVSAGAATLLTGADDSKNALTLPFPFTFYGHAYPMVCVSSNGAAYFVDNEPQCLAIPTDFANTDLSAAAPPGDTAGLFPFWSDLAFGGAGTGVAYQEQGLFPNRKFIIQWNNAYPLSKDDGLSPAPVTFQVILFEHNNEILFQYNTVDLGVDNHATNGGQATIGIRNAGALVDPGPTLGQQIAWSFNSAVLSNSKAILFTSGLATPVMNVTGGTAPYTGSPHTGTGVAYGTGGLSDVLIPDVTLSYAGVSPTVYGPSPDGPTDAGTYEVTGSFAGNPEYTDGSSTASLVITQATQTINFTSTAPAAAKLGGPTYDVTANGGGSGNPVTFSSLTTGVCTLGGIDGHTVSFIGVGSCQLAADQLGNSNYAAATQQTQSFNVGKAAQEIIFTSSAPASPTVGGPTYDVAATGGASGNPVTFSSLTLGICTVGGTGFTVSFVGAGNCQVAANQAGNGNYDAAPQATQNMTVGKGSQTINFTSIPPASPTVGGTYLVSATGGASGNPVTFSGTAGICTASGLNGSTINFVAAGNCQVAANQAGNTNYFAAPQQTQSMTVAPSVGAATTTTITSNHNPVEFGKDVEIIATVRRTSNNTAVPSGTVTFKEGTTVLAGPIPVALDGKAKFKTKTLSVGNHTITAYYNGNATFSPSSVSFVQGVSKAKTKTELRSSKDPSKSGENVTFTATVKDGPGAVTVGTVTFRVDGVVVGGPIALNATGKASFSTSTLTVGTHTIAAAYNGSANYETSTETFKQTVKK